MENNYITLFNTDSHDGMAHKPLSLELDLTTHNREEIDVSRCKTVYEDGHYELKLSLKLADIEQALKLNLAKQQTAKASEKESSRFDGAELARQDISVSDKFRKVVAAPKDPWNEEYASETDSLILNRNRPKQDSTEWNNVKVIHRKAKSIDPGWLANNARTAKYFQNDENARPYIRTQANNKVNKVALVEQDLADNAEDDDNDISLRLFDDSFKRINMIQITLNQQPIGRVQFQSLGSGVYSGKAVFESEGRQTLQPFLLCYDLQLLAFDLKFEDGSSVTLYAPPLLCASLNSKDTENINQILFELTNLENNDLLDLMFKKGRQTASKNSKDDWMKFEENRSYQSLSEYIITIEEIIKCYTNNFSYFKTQAKHTLIKKQQVVPFNHIKQISNQDFNWLTHHLEELKQVDSSLAVLHNQGEHYQPLHMQTEVMRKSYSNYENQVVIGFLHMVLHNANKISKEYQTFILQKREQINQGTQLSHGAYQAPIITMQLIQLERCENELNILHDCLKQLSNLYLNYQQIFKLPNNFLRTFPRKSKIFQELKPYAEVFLMIWRFFHFGSFHLDKDRMLFEVTTLDRLFEYYCLYRLLEMLDQHGFKAIPHGNQIFEYSALKSGTNLQHANNDTVANTYVLRRGEQQAVLYYQPVIYSRCFENGIHAFRTTEKKVIDSWQRGDYYTPDFILKFRNSKEERFQEDYIIFDAKFAQTNSILQNYISELTRKYGFEISIAQLEPHLKSLQEEQAEQEQLNQAGLSPSALSEQEQASRRLSLKQGMLLNRRTQQEYDMVGSKAPRMIFALQGRLNFEEEGQQSFNTATGRRKQSEDIKEQRKRYKGVYMKFMRDMMLVHNSPLSNLCPPPTAIGLVEFNTHHDTTPALWAEIVRNIPYLAHYPRPEQVIAEEDDYEELMDQQSWWTSRWRTWSLIYGHTKLAKHIFPRRTFSTETSFFVL